MNIRKNCLDCGKQLNKYKISIRCHKCARRFYLKTHPEVIKNLKKRIGNNNPNFSHGKYSYNAKNYCKDCGKEISRYKASRCKSCAQKGCNNSMFGKIRLDMRQRVGELNYNYIDGNSKNGYTPEFTEKLKNQVRKRDNYSCQGENCSMTQEEHFIIYGRDIEIHHIDYNRQNCQENNLITLCKQCNIRANYNRQYWQDYYNSRISMNYKEIK